jgi:heavy metal sensor kinase
VNYRSIAFRLSLWYAVLLSVTFALVGFTTFFAVEHYLRSTLSEVLYRRTEQVQNILQTSSVTPGTDTLASKLELQMAPEFTNRFLRITRWPSTRMYVSGVPADFGFNPAQVPAAVIWPQRFQLQRVTLPDGTPLLIGRLRESTASGDYLIEMGSSLAAVEALRDRLLAILALILPILVILAATGGYFLVRRALRPVDQISQTAAKISIGDLNARLPVPLTGDALERLSVALNEMLGRLRDSVQLSQRFLADASHELRTPLTIIRGELENLVSSRECGPVTVNAIGSVLEEVEQLKHLVEGLMAISRLDAGDAKRELVHVDLMELVATTTEQMRLVAEDAGISLEYADLQSVPVMGDRGRLQQVVVNLLDNAIKYTPRGGTVRLHTLRSGREGVLEIRDTGIGIPSEAIGHVFERFYRVDDARSRDSGGVGLGLAIVKAICNAHGALIEVTSTVGVGSRFSIRFPLAREFPVRKMPAASTVSASVSASTAQSEA